MGNLMVLEDFTKNSRLQIRMEVKISLTRMDNSKHFKEM
jgi:hypothetical protein